MVAEIHWEPDFEMVVASVELFATVAEIVAVVDVVVGARVVDEKIGEMVDEAADVECAVADEMIDAVVVDAVAVDAVVVDAVDAMSGVAFDEQDIQKGPALEEHKFPVMSVVDHYLVDTFALRQMVYLSVDCFEHKYCLHLQRKY